MQHFSIKFRLSMGFFLLLSLVFFLGIFSIECLNDFNSVAEQIRDRWLPNTRFLGDINNYTSDFRAFEGTLLLTSGPSEVVTSEQSMNELDRDIEAAGREYERIYHNAREIDLYKRFSQNWRAYRAIVRQALALMQANNRAEAVALYKTHSQSAYNAASDTLGQLTALNVAEDQQASDRAAAAYRKVRLLTVCAMLLAALLVTAGVLYIRRSISDPILSLARNMHLLAGNDMDIAIEETQRRDEVGEMARAVVVFRNNMVDLALNRQGLIQQTSMLEEKLEHERNLATAQRNFITIASHEFRTPLTIIDGHAQRLMKMKNALQPTDIAERTGKIRDAVAQMTDLIDNLINSALLLEGRPELYFHPASLDLAMLLQEVCRQYREIVPAAQIVEKIDGPLTMSGDAKLLRQMFGNLLANAIKYSPEGGLIELSAKAVSGNSVVVVRDEGIGIPRKDIEGVFERYSRGSNVSDISGTGIGLYLAKMVVELHGGSIAVESAEGSGAAFSVCLPLSIGI